MSKSIKHHHYRECGLENVWLANGFTVEDSPYGRGVSIWNVKGLHACIAGLLTDKPTPLTGAEFRFLRKELDLSQRMVGKLFGCDERQVRNWEQSDAVIEPYNRLIRHIYQERQDPSNSFEELFKRLQELDREWHTKLTLSKADSGKWLAA